MTTFQKRLSSAVAAGAILVQVALPALAETTIQITGNGVNSDNFATVTDATTTTVTQSNTAVVNNNVTANADTGKNQTSFNTGGEQVIDTHAATTDVTVANTLNSNTAEVGCCGTGDTHVKIGDNSVGSENTVALTESSNVGVKQTNVADVTNDVYASAKTGENKSSLNTGDGSSTIVTGAAHSDVDVSTTANANYARVGGGSSAAPTVSLEVTGNGAFADNFINATLAKATAIDQANTAVVDNNVEASAKSGNNKAGFNTGDDVVISTGEAYAGADVDNMVNFNSAVADCGCTLNVLAKIDGNGANFPSVDHVGLSSFDHFDFPWLLTHGGDNVINLTTANTKLYGQNNVADLENDVEAKAKTGYNSESLNTGAGEDPVVVTGPAHDNVDVNNTGNVNTIGGSPLFTWPLSGSELNVSFNFNALMALWGQLLG